MNPEIVYSTHSVQIRDSWMVNSREGMDAWIKSMKSNLACTPIVFYRSNRSLRREWKAHNLLYWHNHEVDRTKDCDFNHEAPLRILAYLILSIIFVIFERHKHKDINEPRP